MKLSKSIGPKVLLALSPVVQYVPSQELFDASVSASECEILGRPFAALSMVLTPCWQGSLTLNGSVRNSFISTTILKTELNRPKFSLNLTVSMCGLLHLSEFSCRP